MKFAKVFGIKAGVGWDVARRL